MRACRQDLALQEAIIAVLTYSRKSQVDCGRGNWGLQLEYFSDQYKFTYHNVSSLQRVISHFSHVWLFVSLRTVACQAPLFIGFPRQEYWSGLPCPLPGNLPDPGIKPSSLMPPALAGKFFMTGTTWEAYLLCRATYKIWVKSLNHAQKNVTSMQFEVIFELIYFFLNCCLGF